MEESQVNVYPKLDKSHSATASEMRQVSAERYLLATQCMSHKAKKKKKKKKCVCFRFQAETRKSITCNYMLYKGVVVSKINNHYSIINLGLTN